VIIPSNSRDSLAVIFRLIKSLSQKQLFFSVHATLYSAVCNLKLTLTLKLSFQLHAVEDFVLVGLNDTKLCLDCELSLGLMVKSIEMHLSCHIFDV